MSDILDGDALVQEIVHRLNLLCDGIEETSQSRQYKFGYADCATDVIELLDDLQMEGKL